MTKDSGIIAGGYSFSDSSGEKTETGCGARFGDYWVIKLNKNDEIEWDKTIGGCQVDWLYSLQQTSDGGYILGGYSRSGKSAQKSENSRVGSEDYWAVKLDSNGNIQWDKTVGGTLEDRLTCIQQTRDGGYILGGSSYSYSSFDKTENPRGEMDYWIVKLSSKGKIEWDKTLGGSDDDQLNAIQQTSDGGYILGGWSWSQKSGEKSENSKGISDYWIVKLDSIGIIEWDRTIGGTGGDVLSCLQQTQDGGYILGGWSNSWISGDKTENSRGYVDYWIVKLNEQGQIIWDKTIGGSAVDYLRSLQETSDGGYILGGDSHSNRSGEKSEHNKGAFDYWVVKVDSLGKVTGDKTIGGSQGDQAFSVKEISRDHYILGGYSLSGISGDKTDSSRGLTDYWLVRLNYKMQNNLSIDSAQSIILPITQNNNNKIFAAYPNPAKDVLYVQTGGKAFVSLINQLGKTLVTKHIDEKGMINVATLPSGLYFLKNVTTGKMQKVIITK